MRILTYAGLIALLAVCIVLPTGCGDPEEDDGTRPGQEAVYGANGELLKGAPVSASSPNLVLIVLDTLREDNLALRGDAGTMPRLEARAASAVAFANATAPSPWTMPSMTSLLTGMLPHEHGNTMSMRIPRLPESVPTYAEVLGEGHGYETVVFSNGPWNPKVPWSILQGFDSGITTSMATAAQRVRGFGLGVAPEVIDEWDAARDKSKPYFMLLHTYDPHDPYGEENHPPYARFGTREGEELAALAKNVDLSKFQTPASWTRAFLIDRAAKYALFKKHGQRYMETVTKYMWSGPIDDPDPQLLVELKDHYDAGTTWVDRVLESTLSHMEKRGLLDNTVVVVTSDHGEAFGEHGNVGHAQNLYDELVHIPMVIWGPGPFAEAKIVDTPAALIDVMPTFLDYIGAPDVPHASGRSLLPAIRGEGGRGGVLSEVVVTPDMAKPGVHHVAVSARSAFWKYIVVYDIGAGTIIEELYDLRADPDEKKDLAVDGRVGDTAFPADFCAAIERARDLIWSDAGEMNWRALTPYGVGVGSVTSERPPPCNGLK